ncbi:unnamed protein product [Arctogadus glacialis]
MLRWINTWWPGTTDVCLHGGSCYEDGIEVDNEYRDLVDYFMDRCSDKHIPVSIGKMWEAVMSLSLKEEPHSGAGECTWTMMSDRSLEADSQCRYGSVKRTGVKRLFLF